MFCKLENTFFLQIIIALWRILFVLGNSFLKIEFVDRTIRSIRNCFEYSLDFGFLGLLICKPEKMRKIVLTANDFEMFDTEIGSVEFEFFHKHKDAFKRMWVEQVNFWFYFSKSYKLICVTVS